MPYRRPARLFCSELFLAATREPLQSSTLPPATMPLLRSCAGKVRWSFQFASRREYRQCAAGDSDTVGHVCSGASESNAIKAYILPMCDD